MTSFTMLRNVVPRWFGKIFLPNQRGGFGNVNHCKTRANILSQRKVSKVGKSSNTLSRIYRGESFISRKIRKMQYRRNFLPRKLNPFCLFFQALEIPPKTKVRNVSRRNKPQQYFPEKIKRKLQAYNYLFSKMTLFSFLTWYR